MLDQRFSDAYDQVPNQRRAELTDAEVIQNKDGFVFDGFAAVFDTPAEIFTPEHGQFIEEVRRGAFRKVIASGANVPFVLEHDLTQLLGTTKSGRVRLTEEQRGLRVQANLADTSRARDLKALVESGDVTGMSYGFVAGRGNAEWSVRSNKAYRTLKGFQRLLDVCTTWDPAYAATEAQFRSLAMASPQDADSLQQLIAGVYPQLDEQGNEEAETQVPVGDEDEQRDSGAAVATPRLAARRRRLQLLTLTLEGDNDA
jgi:HK97 family phage prohead protease